MGALAAAKPPTIDRSAILGAVTRTIIHGGTVVNASDSAIADVLVDGERIVAVGRNLAVDTDSDITIDATGCLVIPGGVDVHTHMQREQSSADDHESGTLAAVWGGTTTIVDMATQNFGESLGQGLERWHAGAQASHADFGFHMIVREVTAAVLAELPALAAAGVPSFKLFMADSGGRYMVSDADLFRAMGAAAECGAMIMVHAENGGVIDVLIQRALAEGRTAPINHALTRPTTAEGEAAHRAIALAELAGTPLYIVHLSSSDALAAVREARNRGLPVFAETCPHYLLLDTSDLDAPDFGGAKYVCSPPLRGERDRADLWNGLRTDDLQVVSTDHCPWCFTPDKARGRDDFSLIPNGLPGVEDRLSLLWHYGVTAGHITPERFVDLVASAPARLFGLFPRKGTISPGSDADIVVFDPEAERTLAAATMKSRIDYSPYEGRMVRGAPRTVLLRGRTLRDGDVLVQATATGRYLKRSSAGGTAPPA